MQFLGLAKFLGYSYKKWASILRRKDDTFSKIIKELSTIFQLLNRLNVHFTNNIYEIIFDEDIFLDLSALTHNLGIYTGQPFGCHGSPSITITKGFCEKRCLPQFFQVSTDVLTPFDDKGLQKHEVKVDQIIYVDQ